MAYDPEQDPGVRRLEEARARGASEDEIHAIELELIEQTDNRPQEADVDEAEPVE